MTDTAMKILAAPLGKTHLFYLGQAGYVIKSKQGTLMGIDMYLTNCVERVEGHIGFKRLLPITIYPGEIKFDYVIATHPHFDHFDMDAIPELMCNHKTKLIASVNCRAEVKRLMMSEENVLYASVGDSYQANDIKVECVFCDHGTGAPDAFGLVITLDDKKIYIAGDTCLRIDKIEEIKKCGPFDIMIAPINGAYGNLNEDQCVELSRILTPGLTIPCHYGMFASHGGNLGLFMNNMNKKLPNQKYIIMSVGEKITIY